MLTEHLQIHFQSFQTMALIILFCTLLMISCEKLYLVDENSSVQPFTQMVWISINAFTSLGEGQSRPMTTLGLFIEFFTCFLGILIIPQFVQTIYTIVSNTIDELNINESQRKKNSLVLIEDEHGRQTIGQMTNEETLPEIADILLLLLPL